MSAPSEETPSTPPIPPSTPPAEESSPADAVKQEKEGKEEHNASTYTSVKGIGVSTDRNPRFRRTMEDEHLSLDGFGGVTEQGFFAIYDGHGGRGAVEYVAKNLHKHLVEQLSQQSSVKEALKQSFLITDKGISDSSIQFSGTTAVVLLIRKDQEGRRVLYSANCGDARAVLCRDGKAFRLSYDHKGTDEEETKRIQEAGGFIVLNRVNGVLAVTRSLGDHTMKDYVISEPHITETILTDTDTHLILACDGLWDVATDQEVCDIVCKETLPQKMSDTLLIHALKSGSTDNISIMAVVL